MYKQFFFWTGFLFMFIASFLNISATANAPSVVLASAPFSSPVDFPVELVMNKRFYANLPVEKKARPLPPKKPAAKYAALTFDDGPSPYTPQVLDILKEKNVRATFFVLGSNAEQNPDVIRRIHSEGHIVGNHTWNHPDLTRLASDSVQKEIQATNELLERILGQRIHLFRPPYGNTNSKVKDNIGQSGMKPVFWNVDPADWNLRMTTSVKDRVLQGLKEQSLILLHDGGGPREKTVESLPGIIEEMKAQGYQFVTVPEYFTMFP